MLFYLLSHLMNYQSDFIFSLVIAQAQSLALPAAAAGNASCPCSGDVLSWGVLRRRGFALLQPASQPISRKLVNHNVYRRRRACHVKNLRVCIGKLFHKLAVLIFRVDVNGVCRFLGTGSSRSELLSLANIIWRLFDTAVTFNQFRGRLICRRNLSLATIKPKPYLRADTGSAISTCCNMLFVIGVRFPRQSINLTTPSKQEERVNKVTRPT